MSATLVAKGLAAGHGSHVLFSGLDLVIAPGEVTGVVGAKSYRAFIEPHASPSRRGR